MRRALKRYSLWLVFAVFMVMAMALGGREGLLAIPTNYANGKIVLLLIFFLFLAYSLLATRKENFFRTVGVVNRLWWGRQIGLDLYISVGLSLALIYLIEGSTLVLALWLLPVLIFANLAILPYLLLNYSAIVGHFLP